MIWILLLLAAAAIGVAVWLATRSWPAGKAPATGRAAPGRPSATAPAALPQPPKRPSGLVTLDELRIALADVLEGPQPADAADRDAVERLGLGYIPDLTQGQAAVLLAAHRLAEGQIQAEIGHRDGYDGEKRIEAALVGFIANDPELRERALELTRPRPKTFGRQGARNPGDDPRDIRVRDKLRELMALEGA